MKGKRFLTKIYNFFAYFSMSFMGSLFLFILGFIVLGFLGFILALGFMLLVRHTKEKELKEIERINDWVRNLYG